VKIPVAIRSISIFPAAGIPDKHGVFDSIRYAAIDTAYDYNVTRKGYLYGLYDVLSQSPRFLRVVVADSVYGRAVNSGVITWDLLKEICRHDSTDAVLLLKKAVAYDTLLVDPYNLGNNYSGNYEITCNFDYKVINYTRWAFYQPDVQVQTGTYAFTDTAYFYETGGCDRILSPVAMRSVLYSACFFSGSEVARKLAPVWEDKTKRLFYTGPHWSLKDAAESVFNNQWEEAGQIWESLSVSTNKHLASKAAFNTALAWEREDDLDQALLWVNYADSLVSNKKMKTYRKILEKRIQERSLLDQQMPGD